MKPALLRHIASASLVALVFLCLAWESRLAPIYPGGSWLMLKGLPLLIPLRGIMHGRRYTFQWSSMLILLYLTEGIVRLTTDDGPAWWLALTESMLALVFFGAAIAYVRSTRNRPAENSG